MRIAPRTALALAALVAVAACDRSQAPAAAPTPADPVRAEGPALPAQSIGGLAIEGEGLRIFDAAGAARALPFETPQATVIAAVAASVGGAAPEVTTNSECGAGPVQFARFANGLQLAFQDSKFAGWTLDQESLSTVDGVEVGMSRAALSANRTVEMQEDSTLGAEFSAGDISGFFASTAADSPVTSLYAGLTCFFR